MILKVLDNVLPLDMKVRGKFILEVWHWNGTNCSDMLGKMELDLHMLGRFGTEKIRAIADPTCKADQALNDDFEQGGEGKVENEITILINITIAITY
jgi:hypothetical protein